MGPSGVKPYAKERTRWYAQEVIKYHMDNCSLALDRTGSIIFIERRYNNLHAAIKDSCKVNKMSARTVNRSSRERSETSFDLRHNNEIELQDMSMVINDNSPNAELQFFLPRADGGGQAWLFLAGCFAIEALVWGFPFSFGVFQTYYSSLEIFSQDSSRIAVIGTSATVIVSNVLS